MHTEYELLRRANVYFFDLDGCVYHGTRLDPDAKLLIQQLRKKGREVFFITNNSRERAREIGVKLSDMGLPVAPERIIAATDYVCTHVLETYGSISVKVAGSPGLEEAFREEGVRLLPLHSEETAQLIVIGRDTDFSYRKLQSIAEDARNGAALLSVNPDASHPGENNRSIPETGALAASVEYMLGYKVDYFGKPAPYLFHYGIRMSGYHSEQCVMIGDNLYTDIQGAAKVGMRTVWLRTVHQPCDSDRTEAIKPDYTMNSMKQLRRIVLRA
ncbi:HAD-IIA family hydrolase [Paenibacillus sp. J5C_2022]|uniref:HAD-IIA family hydrolase n=1 Tax=Paenibacillus sp. J5C2022 TaxID=2977129 RepID=UPI0021CF35FF|nr:HAD-IIA family hydrolase [Paenibacillus sp. J5C2022]MCU6708107.1 HAD-IIA family hydrolase [Paenibacillus sp. J5C2022]